jgi:hypothetical protein
MRREESGLSAKGHRDVKIAEDLGCSDFAKGVGRETKKPRGIARLDSSSAVRPQHEISVEPRDRTEESVASARGGKIHVEFA